MSQTIVNCEQIAEALEDLFVELKKIGHELVAEINEIEPVSTSPLVKHW